MIPVEPIFSVIVPVYNRPQEVDELLESLCAQTMKAFETIIVEDGSSVRCDEICKKYPQLHIQYYYKENGGPALARNYGAEKASAEWIVFFDSDCIIPPHYFDNAARELNKGDFSLFGGPDRSHPSFTTLQKAIDYSMTSMITTGGIRGNKKSADKFYPRTFNMGIRRDVFNKIGGFSNLRFGEDVDFSYKVKEGGYESRLLTEEWVYHKRRNTIRTFFKQVFNSGIARIHLTKRHPGTLKLVHLLPSAFTVGTALLVAAAFTAGLLMGWEAAFICLLPLLLLSAIILLDSTMRKGSLKTGLYSICTSFVQLTGYGSGLLAGWWNICVLGKGNYAAFVKNFYK